MSEDDVLKLLDVEEEISESYVLVRHLKLYLSFAEHSFYPRFEVKIWKSWVNNDHPYHFTVSHHVSTPIQAGAYHPSRTSEQSEATAIRQAISTTTAFLRSAIAEGHRPTAEWLVRNEEF